MESLSAKQKQTWLTSKSWFGRLGWGKAMPNAHDASSNTQEAIPPKIVVALQVATQDCGCSAGCQAIDCGCSAGCQPFFKNGFFLLCHFSKIANQCFQHLISPSRQWRRGWVAAFFSSCLYWAQLALIFSHWYQGPCCLVQTAQSPSSLQYLHLVCNNFICGNAFNVTDSHIMHMEKEDSGMKNMAKWWA